jgi:hypothetical protein
MMSLSCQWSIEQIKWSNSGEILDKVTFLEGDTFLFDKGNMTGTKGSLGARQRTYKMTIGDHSIDLIPLQV